MAPRNDDLHEIMAQSRAERQALFEPVSEISRRLQPRHLVDVTTHYAKRKVTGVIGDVSDAIKDNGGTAAGLALGAIAVFDAGRRSVEAAQRWRTVQSQRSPTELQVGKTRTACPLLVQERP
jgi:hypothetical protein